MSLEEMVRSRVLTRLQGGLDEVKETDAQIRKGITSGTHKLLSTFFTTLSVQDSPDLPPPILVSLQDDLKDVQASIQNLDQLKTSLLTALEELQSLSLPELEGLFSGIL